MAITTTIATVASTAVSAVSSIQAGNAQAENARYNAAVADEIAAKILANRTASGGSFSANGAPEEAVEGLE